MTERRALSRRDLLHGCWRPAPIARIDPARCLAASSFCAACQERCPVPGALRLHRGHLSVDPTRCDGCGVCEQICPAPGGAIRLSRG